MRVKLICVVCLLLSAIIPLNSQELNQPRISNVTVLPSEPVHPSGNCTMSRSGYLEKNGKTKIKKAEIGNFVDSSLRDGYIVTIYPESTRGIFVNMECIAEKNPAVSKVP
jgi:hypothetical protein